MQPGIIIQARLSSSRFPKKIIAKYKGKTLIEFIVDECKKTKLPIIVAIPEEDFDFIMRWFGDRFIIFTGSSNDLISRYYNCAKKHGFDPIIRVTGDAKMINHELILQQLENYKKYGHLCYGNFCEVFSFKQLEEYYLHDKRPQTREHVTLGMIQDMSVDYEIDLY